MLNMPSQHDVRRFFCAAFAAWRDGLPQDAMGLLAAQWIAEHPEYHADLADVQAALARDYSVEAGRSNPFLHLAMHLSISEQVSVDQPRGTRAALHRLDQRLGSTHAAHHVAMECLGRMVWESQRSGRPPDGEAYVECLRRAAR